MRRAWLLRLLLLVLALGLCEGLLRVATALFPAVRRLAVAGVPAELFDPDFGYVPNPAYPENDRWGFRNGKVPDRAEVVTLGDSQTWGYGVAASEAWPRRLARAEDLEVYDMSFGGWGPTHHLSLLDRALSLQPRWVIAALYAGNDLYDAYDLVYHFGRFSGLRTGSPEDLAAIESAPTFKNRKTKRPEPEPWYKRGSRALGRHVRLWGLAYNLLGSLGDGERSWEAATARVRGADPSRRYVVETEGTRTILTPHYRLRGLDLDNARIREGHRIALESLRRIQQRTEAAGARLLVLFLPTKELVFLEAVRRGRLSAPHDYERLVSFEREMWERTRRVLEARGVLYVDALPALRESLREGERPYVEDRDGHPTAAGHRAIAAAVGSGLESETAGVGVNATGHSP